MLYPGSNCELYVEEVSTFAQYDQDICVVLSHKEPFVENLERGFLANLRIQFR